MYILARLYFAKSTVKNAVGKNYSLKPMIFKYINFAMQND